MTKKKKAVVTKSPTQKKPQEVPKAFPENDELDREVGISIHVAGLNLDLKTKSRAIAALDRLFGGLFGWPAAHVESSRAQAESKYRALADSSRLRLPEKVIRRVISEELRKQVNLEAVWTQTEKSLIELASDNVGFAENGPDEISSDWMNHFTSFAEKASSENMQKLWGRILAGEIRRPSTFSLSTLRIIFEADPDTAQAFQDIAIIRLDGAFLGLKDGEYATPVAFGRLSHVNWFRLQEAGLIHTFADSFQIPDSFRDTTENIFQLTPNYGLFFGSTTRPGTISFNHIKFTRAGNQICSILPRNEIEACRKVAYACDLGPITIFQLADSRNGQTKPVEVEKINGLPNRLSPVQVRLYISHPAAHASCATSSAKRF